MPSNLQAQGYYGSDFQAAMREIKGILNDANNSTEVKAKAIMDRGRAFNRKKKYKEADSIFAIAYQYGLENTKNLYFHKAKANGNFFLDEKKKKPLKFKSRERLKAMDLYVKSFKTSAEDYKKIGRENLQKLENVTKDDIYELLGYNPKIPKNEKNLELASSLTDLYIDYYPKAFPYEFKNRKKELNENLRNFYLSIASGYRKLMNERKDETYQTRINGQLYKVSYAKKYYDLAMKYADKALALDIYNMKAKNFISELRNSYGRIESDKKSQQLIVQEQKFESSQAELSSVKGELEREKMILDSLMASKDQLIQEVKEEHAKLQETSKLMDEYKEELGATSVLLENQKLINVIISIVLIIILVLAVFAVRGFRMQRKQNKIIEKNRNEIHQQHIEITDSIAYAKRIQSAIMPSMNMIKEHLPESFIFYEPKDVVAGDFYWLSQPAGKGKSKTVYIAAADCTGHGVPGAMVSVVCNSALNRSVNEFGLTKPGEILTKTRELVIEEFAKSGEAVRDGMDIAFCAITGDQLEYAGANNPLWIIRKEAQEVEAISAHKQAIGLAQKITDFPTEVIQLQKGDSFYIFSDGFADQFGGEKGKKLKATQFRELLLSIQDQSMEEQLQSVSRHFYSWKGNLDQIDDVCVIGVRV